MPIAVDHQSRKMFVAETTARQIAEVGLEATSLRTVARAAGFSTSIITHYFDSKAALLSFTYESVAAKRGARLDRIMAKSTDPLADATVALLPIGPDGREDWLVYCAYLASGIARSEMAGVQAKWIQRTEQLFEEMITEEFGPTRDGVSARDTALRLVSMVTGLSVMNVVDPDRHSEADLRRIARREVEILRGAHAVA
ncbi:MAG: TetR/AcrR family transcriptional regulator [Pseudomonadota bacterium]|nr:TetR/AcrR family transcriptional regulator [Pseudomonadota bacterium]